MQKPIKKIGLLVVIILILPISAFFIYQFASLNESEEEINRIYVQQLETIIFSINQYSEDIVSSWANNINLAVKSPNQNITENIESLIIENPSIKSVFIADTNFNDVKYYYLGDEKGEKSATFAINPMDLDEKIITRSVDYLNAGYQKIEAIGSITEENLNLCFFPILREENVINICGILFNPNDYVRQNLVSKLSQICGEEFILGIIDETENSIVHSCDRLDLAELALKKPLWLIPGFTVGIKSAGGNLEDLVKQRYYINLIILCTLLLILLAGIGLIYQNLKRELRLTQLKSDFVSNVSHELRTPLSLISMYSETLVLDRLKSEEKKMEYFSVIHNETNRLSKIVNTILNFSKMESGTREYHFTKFELKDLNEEVFRTYDYHISSKGFKYKVNYSDANTTIKADKDAVSESIINLIENALKYSENKKEIEVTIDKNNTGPFWEIKDYGIGINAEDQKKIFDKFFRVSSGLVHNTKGTGLGLSLVKQIMLAHNGDVSVKSSIGEGSVFRLQFNNDFVQ